MRMLLLFHILVVTAMAGAPTTLAWRKEGHYMVCKIAEGFLTSEASMAVKELLPAWAGGDLAETCSWADDQRSGQYRWSRELHFASTAGDCMFSYARDCHDSAGEKGRCVVGAINNYTAALMDSSSPYDPTESLMFLAHFVGDIHQPLHCGRIADRGGNNIIVNWYGSRTNLHHVWDGSIINTAMKDFYNDDLSTMIEAIKLNITEDWGTCVSRTKTCADTYAQESAKLACNAYVGVEQDCNLEDEYFFSALPVVQKRIAQGGVRLAAILNQIFSGSSRLQSS